MLTSKSLEPADYKQMPLGVSEATQACFWMGGQGVAPNLPHENRIWEYASALEALRQHFRDTSDVNALDVGCGASLLSFALLRSHGCTVTDIDPSPNVVPFKDDFRKVLWRYKPMLMQLYTFKPVGVQDITGTYDAVFCISVMEHVSADKQQEAWRKLAALVAPGGMLFATVDYCADDSPHLNDPSRDFRYTPANVEQVRDWLADAGISLSGFDPAYNGDQVWNYTFFRLVGKRI